MAARQLGDTVEFESWTFSIDRWAEVLAPKTLRDEIRGEPVDVVKLYRE
jgi:hypothetical protein